MTVAADILSLLLLFTLQIPGQALPISGLLNRSLELPTGIIIPVREVIWTHTNNGTELQIIKIQNGSLVSRLDDRYNPDFNGRSLVIDNLTKDDNGIYIAEITLLDYTLVKWTFNVTIHDPIPPVQITQEVRRIGNQWNISLKCSVASNTSDLSYTWLYRHRNSSYQSTANTGNRMQTVLPLDHQGVQYMCIVQNLDDQRNTSIHIEPCSEDVKNNESADNNRNLIIAMSVLAVVVVVVLGAVMALLVWKGWKRSSKTSEDTSYSTVESSDRL